MADDEISELILAGNLTKNAGYNRAAFYLGRECARLIQAAKKHPRKQGVWVTVNGHKAFLDKDAVDRAEEYE
ncbi:MAG TPA: hypothetical protein DCP69_04140 [Candidatus Omnitrophica bacterium]|nr:hypothetical protein [Candidatus Omnitrophota bacterium]